MKHKGKNSKYSHQIVVRGFKHPKQGEDRKGYGWTENMTESEYDENFRKLVERFENLYNSEREAGTVSAGRLEITLEPKE